MRHTMRDMPPVRRGMHPSNQLPLRPTSDSKKSGESSAPPTSLLQTTSRDHGMEKSRSRGESSRGTRRWANKEDPFGDEEGAEVKYRTLRWW